MIRKAIVIIFITFPLYCSAMNLEVDTTVGAQTSWPISGQYGVGGAINFSLTSLILFPYLSLDVNGVEYIDKTVYFKEINYGLGTKLLYNTLIYRASLGRMYRMYEGLADESWRAELGFGTRVQSFEITLNYRHYYPLEKHAVVLMTGMVF